MNTLSKKICTGVGVALILIFLGFLSYPFAINFFEEQSFQSKYSSKKDFSGVFTTWKENRGFIRQNPNNDSAWYSLGQGYYALGGFDDAIFAFNEAARINPKNDYYWSFLGKAHQAQKDAPRMIEAFVKALEANPKRKENTIQLAWAYYFRTDDQAAKAYDVLRNGLKAFPGDKDLLWDITRYYAYDKNTEEFQKYAPQLLKVDPGNELVKSVMKEIKEKGKIQ